MPFENIFIKKWKYFLRQNSTPTLRNLRHHHPPFTNKQKCLICPVMLFETELNAFWKYFYKKMEIFFATKFRHPSKTCDKIQAPLSKCATILRPYSKYSIPQHIILTPPITPQNLSCGLFVYQSILVKIELWEIYFKLHERHTLTGRGWIFSILCTTGCTDTFL